MLLEGAHEHCAKRSTPREQHDPEQNPDGTCVEASPRQGNVSEQASSPRAGRQPSAGRAGGAAAGAARSRAAVGVLCPGSPRRSVCTAEDGVLPVGYAVVLSERTAERPGSKIMGPSPLQIVLVASGEGAFGVPVILALVVFANLLIFAAWWLEFPPPQQGRP